MKSYPFSSSVFGVLFWWWWIVIDGQPGHFPLASFDWPGNGICMIMNYVGSFFGGVQMWHPKVSYWLLHSLNREMQGPKLLVLKHADTFESSTSLNSATNHVPRRSLRRDGTASPLADCTAWAVLSHDALPPTDAICHHHACSRELLWVICNVFNQQVYNE